MRSRTKNILSLSFVFILICIAIYSIVPPAESTKLGLDLKGGLSVLLTAKGTKEAPITEDSMEQAMLIIRERVDKLGVSEPQIQRQGSNNILVQLPGIEDPQKALDIIGKTALLEFKPVVSQEEDKIMLGSTLMTGKALSDASVGFDEFNNAKVEMKFTAEGAKKFEEVTGEIIGQQLAIVLDGAIMSAPTVQAKISGGSAEITGNFTVDEAKSLALVLQTGALPVNLEISENRVVGPTLGRDSLRAGLIAGIIGLMLVVLYMIIYYRGLGLITTFALIVFGTLFWGLIAIIGKAFMWTLTLPGIAGMILSIGLAADSSIVIFERFKEEVKGGRTVRMAAETGFSHAIKTMLDADLVTLVAVIFLYLLAIGPVRGFAFTLIIGVLIDLFTAFFFTRPMLILMAQFKFFSNPLLIGAKRETK
ncbi:protein translocase subunit SecD [Candidatus Oleimmundimicrobium sp.]|uniref:protein translocase subunit SecD n=1 Tax=Candidatus Oleimmundimicrobium sp. TaxID=3060597 RepID=UPI00271C9B57|nr:protein translocase subunit SecD [Candidatus Oleimmundimicrobium sp.]MDO8886717.1 protein translocase subunit SecD [Candidatus Oleimmundimicrobium sp.]